MSDKSPDLIWLQWSDVDDYTGDGAVTWCADKINSDDVQYVRADWLLDVLRKAGPAGSDVVRAALKGEGDDE